VTKRFESQFEVGRHINLRPPVAMIVGVHFRQQGPHGPMLPTYTILHDGQIDENITEDTILGYNDIAQQQWENQLAAQRAVNAANLGGAAHQPEVPGEPSNDAIDPPVVNDEGERVAQVDTSQPA
jgi:hypothetical protein